MIRKLWANLNYRYCRVEEYLALNRGEIMEAVEWRRQAHDWARG